MNKAQADKVLNFALDPQQNDAGASTVRGYIVALAAAVWAEEEGFSGKRPFGNSGWKHEVLEPMLASGQFGADEDRLDRMINDAIAYLR